MTSDVFDTFTELHRERRLDTQKVFLYKGKPWKNPRTAFAAACRRAGITGLRLHDLRHTASTNLRRAGVDTMTAMKIVDTSPNRCIGGIIRFSRKTCMRRRRSFKSTRLTR